MERERCRGSLEGGKGAGEGCPQAEGSGAGSDYLGNELYPSAVRLSS